MHPKKPEQNRASRRYRPGTKKLPPLHSKLLEAFDTELEKLAPRLEAAGYAVPIDRMHFWKEGAFNLIFKWLRNVEGLEPDHPPRRPPVFLRKYETDFHRAFRVASTSVLRKFNV
jgi:hypothetical protein